MHAVEERLQDLMRAWFPRALDHDSGGYIENFDYEWKPTGDRRRALVHQARLAWSAAAFAQHDSTCRSEFAAYALHGIRFIDAVFRDEKYGGFYFDIDGHNPARNGEKHAYALAFAMFAGAKTHAVTGDPPALAIAEECFDWLNQHSLQGDGSYFEELERDGAHKTHGHRSLRQKLSKRPARNPLGDEYGHVTLNTQMHILEGLTELYQVGARPDVKARIDGLIELLVSRCDESGRVPERLGTVSPIRYAGFGHSLELAYLLLEASRVTASSQSSRVQHVAKAIAVAGLRNGSADKDFGIWWVQAEALNTWITMYRLDGDVVWARAIEDQWDFIREHLIDRKHGGWYTGTPGVTQKSDAWIDPYHNARALINGLKM